MFELSISPAIAPVFAPVLAAPAVGTGDFALVLAEATAELPAAMADRNAVVLPPDRQKLAAPKLLLQTTREAPIPVIDPATPITLPRLQPTAIHPAPQLRLAAPPNAAVTVVESPAPLPQALHEIPATASRNASNTDENAAVVRDPEDDVDDVAVVANLFGSALPVVLPLIQAPPAAPSVDSAVANSPLVRTPPLASPSLPLEPGAIAQPAPDVLTIIDLPTPTIGLRQADVSRATAVAVPFHAHHITPIASRLTAVIDIPVSFTPPLSVLIPPAVAQPLTQVPRPVPTPVPIPLAADDRLVPVRGLIVTPPLIGVPVPALRAFAAGMAATSAHPAVDPFRRDTAPGVPRTVASPPAIAVGPADAPTAQTVVVNAPGQVPGTAITSVPKPTEVVAQTARPARLTRDDDAIVTPLTVAAQPDLAARSLDATTRPLPPVDMRREDWTRALIDRIDAVRDVASARDTRITLVPDALGKIDVDLRQEGETLHVAFTADAPATRLLLVEAQPRLAELAEARGLRLGDTAVSANADGDRTGNGFGQPADQRRPAPAPQATAASRSTTTNPVPDRADTDNRIA